MGDMRIFVKGLVWLKQASICIHNVPKDAKIQNFWGKFSTFLDLKKNFIKNHDFRVLKI